MDALFYKKNIEDTESRYHVTLKGLNSNVTTGGIITGVLNSPIPLAGRNEFSSLKSELEDIPLIGSAVRFGNKIAKGSKLFAGKTFALELEQTRKVWQESAMPQLSLEMTFWGLKSGDVGNRPIDKLKAINSALFPVSSPDSFLISAPLNYKWLEGKRLKASGTLELSVGNWLSVDQLVMTDANLTPSIEVMRDGTPLYVTGTMTLEPYRMLTYDEFLLWFRERPEQDNVAGGTQGDVVDLGQA